MPTQEVAANETPEQRAALDATSRDGRNDPFPIRPLNDEEAEEGTS